MTRVVGPESNSRFVYRTSGNSIVTAAGATAVVFANETGSTLADILTEAGSAIAGSTVTVDAFSRLPLFQFPDGVSTVFVEVAGGPRSAVYNSSVFGGPAPANGPDYITTGWSNVTVGAHTEEFPSALDIFDGDDGNGNVPAWAVADGGYMQFTQRGLYAVSLSFESSLAGGSLEIRANGNVVNELAGGTCVPVGPVRTGGDNDAFAGLATFIFAAIEHTDDEDCWVRPVPGNSGDSSCQMSLVMNVYRLIAFG